MNKKLKFFTDLGLLRLGQPVEMLFPFINGYDKTEEAEIIRHGRFDKYLKEGKEFLEISSLENCDICLLPVYYDVIENQKEFEKEIEPFIRQVEASGKKILIFVGHDVLNIDIDVKNAIIFNSAISKSKQAANVHAWPHFFEDFLERYSDSELKVRHKGAKPVVGFCGYAPPLGVSMGREKIVGAAKLLANYMGVLQKYPHRVSHSYRARAVRGLQKSAKVITNFRLKSSFAFGPKGFGPQDAKNNETADDFRRKFVENILESDYTVCVRGLGNNSIRFFETICCGRIPVFVNTDSTLPFSDVIDWKKLCVWVEEEDIDRISERLAIFHAAISDEDFIKLQEQLRNIWEEYLSPTGFFKHLHHFVKD